MALLELRSLSLKIISEATAPEDEHALRLASDLVLLLDEIEELKREIRGHFRKPIRLAKAS